MSVETKPQGRDLFENPLGTDGFEFVEFTSPEPERLKGLFELMGFTAVSKHRSKNVLRFRQGAGRLVRRQTDRGALVLLDPRIVRRSYGVHFRRGLPVPLREPATLDELLTDARAFLSNGGEAG